LIVPGEFELIARFFTGLGARRADVTLGVGDDAALVRVPAGHELVVTVDGIAEGVDFLADARASDVGHRALAVNLSDLAAMGAAPAWATLSLTVPAADEAWLEDFAQGLDALARAHGVELIGGDLARGPRAAVIQALGMVPAGQALTRSGARPADLVYVTGWPGDAAAGLAILDGRLAAAGASRSWLIERFLRPEPRVAFGQRLRGVASACIDVSDGLAQDLAQLARASGVGAVLDAEALPLSRALHALCGEERARRLALCGGDDYELLFTVAPAQRGALAALAHSAPACHCIGEIVPGAGVRVRAPGGDLPIEGYDHFRV
jgi:thiamine-monophosphate kinase